MRDLLKDEGGQAIVDYVLTLLVVVSVVTILAKGFRTTLLSLWQMMAREISAPCPGCAADPRIRLR